MASGKRVDTSGDRCGRHMNRIATWPVGRKGRTPAVTDLDATWPADGKHMNRNAAHGQGKRVETSSDRRGDKWMEMLMASRERRTPGDKWIEMLHGRAETSSDRPGRRMNRNATWPVEQGGHQQPGDKWIENARWPAENGDTSSDRPGRQMNRIAIYMASGKGRDTSSDRPGRQMNRNATWPAEKGRQGDKQWQRWETNK